MVYVHAANGAIGYIPAPLAGQQNYVLTGAGSWAPSINTATLTTLAGKQKVLFDNIPSYVKRITVMINAVNIGSVSIPIVQLGSGTIKEGGYFSVATYTGPNMGCGNFTNGWYVTSGSGSGDSRYGNYYITHSGGNLWTCTGSFAANNSFISFCSGSVTLTGGLDRVQLATSNGSDLFAAGTVNILYE